MDVIITTLVPGELSLCYPDFKSFPEALIIGIGDNKLPVPERIPECCRDILIISRAESVLNLRQKIVKALKSMRVKRMPCEKCVYTKISYSSVNLMRLILGGNSVEQCAKNRCCGPKAFYASKYSFMAKCGLKNNYELVTLARTLMRRKHYIHEPEMISPPFIPEPHSNRH